VLRLGAAVRLYLLATRKAVTCVRGGDTSSRDGRVRGQKI